MWDGTLRNCGGTFSPYCYLVNISPISSFVSLKISWIEKKHALVASSQFKCGSGISIVIHLQICREISELISHAIQNILCEYWECSAVFLRRGGIPWGISVLDNWINISGSRYFWTLNSTQQRFKKSNEHEPSCYQKQILVEFVNRRAPELIFSWYFHRVSIFCSNKMK